MANLTLIYGMRLLPSEEAVEVGTHIGVLSQGVLLQMAAADELVRRPQSLKVARFFGFRNELGVRIRERRNGLAQVELGDQLLQVLDNPDLKEGGQATLILQETVFSLAPSEASPNRCRGRILRKSPLPGGTLIEVELIAENRPRLRIVIFGQEQAKRLMAEEVVSFVFSPEDGWLVPNEQPTV